MTVVSFIVVGIAQPAGSKKIGYAGGRPGVGRPFIIDDNSKSKHWKAAVRSTAQGAALRERLSVPVFAVPVDVKMIFRRTRPASHLNSKGLPNAHGLRHPFPDTPPDVLKLARAVEDAMTGVIYTDDALIVRELIEKEWGDRDEVEVHVSHAIVETKYVTGETDGR